jgi:hypothetical protein
MLRLINGRRRRGKFDNGGILKIVSGVVVGLPVVLNVILNGLGGLKKGKNGFRNFTQPEFLQTHFKKSEQTKKFYNAEWNELNISLFYII